MSNIINIRKYHERIRKREKVFRLSLCVYIFLWLSAVIYIVLFVPYNNEIIAGMIFAVLPIWIGGVLYFTYYFPFFRSVNWLRKHSCSNAADDAKVYNPRIIAYGKQALICLKPYAIIPYSMMAWVYCDHRYDDYDEITSTEVIIYCKDGKRFKLPFFSDNAEEITRLAPHVIVGAGLEKKSQYLLRYPIANDARSVYRQIGAIILFAIAACLIGLSLYFGKITFAGGLLVLLLIVFVVLLLQKSKLRSNQKLPRQ